MLGLYIVVILWIFKHHEWTLETIKTATAAAAVKPYDSE
jgi:hypothetical protein